MKTVMITGADAGLGFETALKIAADGELDLILACRNEEKAKAACEEITAATGNGNVSVELLDVSSLESIRACADRIAISGRKLDVLINNAGISPQHSGTTPDGFELVFETNYLGPFALTLLLLPCMAPEGGIFMVSSDMHNPPGGIEWQGLDYLAYHAQDDRARYSYSKLCDLLFAYELARKLKAAGLSITSNAFNPGFMDSTNFSGPGSNPARAQFVKLSMPERYSTLEASSTAFANLITSGEYRKVTGAYFDRDKGIGESSALSYDQRLQEQVWNESLKLAGMSEPSLLR